MSTSLLFLLVIVVIVAVVAFLVMRGRQPVARAVQPRVAQPLPAQGVTPAGSGGGVAAGLATAVSAATPATPLVVPVIERTPPPPALAGLAWRPAADLPAEQLAALVMKLRQIPRPPTALQELVSPSFLNTATSAQVSEVVMTEPALVARVLAAVNAPVYRLSTPITSVGQGITFLGMNTVRGLAQRYLLADSFPAGDAETRKRFDAIWSGAAVGNDLAGKLASALGLADGATLATAVTLSFGGRLAMILLAGQQGQLISDEPALAPRLRDEQERFGLGTAETVAVLLREWRLPDGVVERVRGIDRTLLEPLAALAPDEALRRAVCYLAARLGERLAAGTLANLAAFDLAASDDPDFHTLRMSLPAERIGLLMQALAKVAA